MAGISDRLCSLIRNPETPSHVLRDAVMDEDDTVANAYLILGLTGDGERGDVLWPVAAYLDRQQADIACSELNNWLTERGLLGGPKSSPEHPHWPIYRPTPPDKPPGDPNFQFDSDEGAEYEVVEVPLRVEGATAS